ncbi:DUF4328 domain-containing protein [Streptomyces sp. NBC_01244]|uniref:DUF4328 domain-containing protein n=1 Tax=Streptomyces sp. NBC_01244 TaxID=2903797 RepID=UPI002E14AE39|nr:DUF4328 domain-containing protein [Streptomyces sp. NBC_01244]
MSSSTPAPSPSPYPYPPSRPAQLLRSPDSMAKAATVLLMVGAVAHLLSTGFNLHKWQVQKQLIADPAGLDYDNLASIDGLDALVGFLQQSTMLATVVVFIIWFHRVRCNAEVFRPDGFSQSAGWAIGGWFVPIANLFLPYRTARETWDASAQYAPDGSYRHVSGAPVVAWWLTFIAGSVISKVAAWNYAKTAAHEGLRDAFLLGAVGDLTTVVAAVLAVLFVRGLTLMQGLKAAQGPNAAV